MKRLRIRSFFFILRLINSQRDTRDDFGKHNKMKNILFLISLFSSSFSQAQLLIEDPVSLQSMEAQGVSFSEVLFATKLTNNKDLFAQTEYKTLVTDLETDLKALQAADVNLGPSMKYSHRLFDVRWLQSSSARFELVGIVNRMDRAIFNPGTCGELRLIYRLSYEKNQSGVLINSRLPMTANAVFKLPLKDSCKEIASQWTQINTTTILEWTKKSQLKSLELNLQSVRWPSTVRGDMGGHAEYFMSVYHVANNGKWIPAPLENTPDVDALNTNSQLKQELLSWLLKPEQIQALDKGVLNIPEKFLARKVSSFALHGMNRLANRPFDSVFKKEDFQNIDYSKLTHIYGASSFRRRLNDMSCAGCHQGRTIAGFHFLGTDHAKTVFANSIFSSQSPHMIDEIPRRRKYWSALLEGKTADPSRPFSERDPLKPGALNAHCGLSSEYKAWTCAAGLKCTAVVAPEKNVEIGECLPETPIAGNPCEPGLISQTRNAHKDGLKPLAKTTCGSGMFCETTRVGFPGGMCSGGCADLKPGETCGAIAVLVGFNNCLAKSRPFSQCLAENTRPGALQACDNQTACRADYICMKTSSGKGACIPPYFLFQLRVDGHPSPI